MSLAFKFRFMTRALRTLLGAALAFSFVPQIFADEAADSPSAIIRTSSQRILSELKNRRQEFQASDRALFEFIKSEFKNIFDEEYSARLVLGRNSRGISEDDLHAFSSALSENLLGRYGRALLEVDAATTVGIRGERTLREGKIVQVSTEVQREVGAPIPVDYLLHPANGQWRIFDVIVEGVSYVQTFRNQFDPLIRREGLPQVIADLRAGKIEVNATQ